MKIKDPKYFHFTIEDVKWKRNQNGEIFITEWIGYGPISVPFTDKKIYLKKLSRKPIFTRLFGNIVLEIDVREHLKRHLLYIEDKEKDQIEKDTKITTSFKDFERKKDGEQLSLF
jgi:hypothetical protein